MKNLFDTKWSEIEALVAIAGNHAELWEPIWRPLYNQVDDNVLDVIVCVIEDYEISC